MVSGQVLSYDDNNALRAFLDVSDGTGRLVLLGPNGNENMWMSGAGDDGNLGAATFSNSAGEVSTVLGVTTSNWNEFGYLNLYGANGNLNVKVSPQSTNRNHGSVDLLDANGAVQMRLWVNDSGLGEVRTDILTILSGAFLDIFNGAGRLVLTGSNGNENVWISGAGSDGNLGAATFSNSAGEARTVLGVTTSNGNEFGYLNLYGANGNLNLKIGPQSTNRNHGSVDLLDANGAVQMRLWVNDSGDGEVRTDILKIFGGSDLAEPFAVNGTDKIEPGMVVVLDPENPGQLRLATTAYDPLVAGIISGAGGVNPGIIMQQEDREIAGQTFPVALTGQVYVWAVGPVQVGDLLTSSDTPGYAMAATDRDRAFGSVIGKAMTSLDGGAGLVLVLVTLQ
jgi:hypothetical protein